MHVFSASQVDTYLLCPRKWAWRKVEGIEAPANPSAELGSAVHEQLEGWLRDGKPLDLQSEAGQIAMAGIHHLPPPRAPGLEVEREFLIRLGGHLFTGRKDWELGGEMGGPRLLPLVGDHKTTKDFRWAKSPEVLREDVQACLYAAEAMLRRDIPACDLQWTYFRTRGARASEMVRLRVTEEQIAPTLRRTIQAADEMTAILRAGLRAEDLPINPGACEAFGGCPYQSNCNLTPEQRFRAMMQQQSTQDLLAMLQSRAPAINPPEGAAPQPPPPPPAPPVWDPVAAAYRAPDGSIIPWGPPAAAAPPPPPPVAVPAQPVWDGYGKTWRDPVSGQPVPEPPTYPMQAAPNVGEQVLQQAAAQGVPVQPQSSLFLQAAGAALSTPPAAPAEAPAPAKRGPGRPRKQAPAQPPVQAPGAPAEAPVQSIPLDQYGDPVLVREMNAAAAPSERGDVGAKIATLIRQVSSQLLTIAAIAEELDA